MNVVLVDDKAALGGKLVLQTHKFFGSIDACHAGTRGIDIATKLEQEVARHENVRTWLNSTVLSVFSDRRVGGPVSFTPPRAPAAGLDNARRLLA